jgi:hypothetical protein
MAILEMVLSMGLSGLIGLLLLNLLRRFWQQQQLRAEFYRLLLDQEGCLSLIQLAAAARVDASIAQAYLQDQMRQLNGLPDVDAEGNVFYRFPRVHPPAQTEEHPLE